MRFVRKQKKKYHCTENQNLNLNTERSLWIGFLIIRLFGNLKVIILFTGVIFSGTCKVRDEIETKRNETERNEKKSNEMKRNRSKRNETKSNETFRTLQVPSFDSGFSKNEILELIVFN